MKNTPSHIVGSVVKAIEPFDDLERLHSKDALAWIDSGAQLFRISKPDNPPKHLVSYFVLFDEARQSVLLIDHIKAGLWLPPGGHVDMGEDPLVTVTREAAEELNITADFTTPFGEQPLFVTVTQTRNAGTHTDVSLWYVIKGREDMRLQCDSSEMNNHAWLGLDAILGMEISGLEPHMHRFVRKMQQRLGAMV